MAPSLDSCREWIQSVPYIGAKSSRRAGLEAVLIERNKEADPVCGDSVWMEYQDGK